MMAGLYTGMRLGGLPVRGGLAALVDVLLLAQFAVGHSLMLTARGRAWLARLVPYGLGSPLSTTTFALASSLQLGIVFLLWAPLGDVWWEPTGMLRTAWTVVYAASWLVLMKTMSDAGLGIQTGHLGWSAVVRDRRPIYGDFPAQGTFRHVRQPVYVAFALTLWTGPVWTLDHLLIAGAWTAYCLVGPLFKERRYLGIYGDRFECYRRLVPYWIPRVQPADVRPSLAERPGRAVQ